MGWGDGEREEEREEGKVKEEGAAERNVEIATERDRYRQK